MKNLTQFSNPVTTGITAIKKYTKIIFLAVFILLFTNRVLADYTINSGVTIDASNALITGNSGVLTINGTLTVSSNVFLSGYTSVIINGPNGQIFWSANKDLKFSAGISFDINGPTPGLQPVGGNASKSLTIGSIVMAVASNSSNNAPFSFASFNSGGGLPKFTITSSSSPACYGSAITATITPIGNIVGFDCIWSINNSGSISPGSVSNFTTAQTATITPTNSASLKTYIITCNLYVAGNANLLATKTVSVDVNPLPTKYTVTGGGVYCSGGTGIAVGLSNSFAGVNYQLQLGGVNTGSAVAGTGSAISFGLKTVAGTYTVVATNSSTGCSVTMMGSAVITVASNTWTGAISSNWSVAGNWSCGVVPTAVSDVTIPTGIVPMPQLTATSVSNSLTLQSGAVVDLNGQNYTNSGGITGLGKLKGSALSNLTINAPGIASTVIFDQTTDGTTNALNNFTVNGAGATITLSTKMALYGVLTPTAGTLTLNDILVLKSTSSGTASVAAVTATITYGASGKVTVERYFPSHRGWHLATAPLSGTGSIFSTWQNGGVNTAGIGTYVTGTVTGTGAAGNGLDAGPQLNSSLKAGNALTVVNNTKSMSLSGSTGSADNKGYFLFVRGDRTNTNFNTAYSNTTTLSSSGSLQTGNQTFNAVTTVGGYTLIGNPYASPVDFALLTRTNLANNFYAWDPYLNTVGGYVFMTETSLGSGTYAGVPTRSGGQTGIIQSSQAIFVKTSGASPSLTFTETAKSSVNNLTIFRPMDTMDPNSFPSFRTNLSFYGNTGNIVLADGNLARFDDSYNPGVDFFDALKFGNVNETFGILSGTTSLVLDCRPLLTKVDTLFFKLARARQFKYQFEFIAANLEQDNLAGFLEDQFMHTATPINLNSNTKVDFEVTSDAASAATDRFRIVFKPSAVFTSLTATVLNSDIGVEWSVANELNIKGYDIERSTDSVHFTQVGYKASSGNSTTAVGYNWLDVSPALGYHYYRIRSISNNNVIGYSNVVKIKLNKSTPAIYVFPNPVTESTLHLQMNSMPKGDYSTRLINNLGQVINTSKIYHQTATATEAIQPKHKLFTGVYQLQITEPNKKATTIQIFVK